MQIHFYMQVFHSFLLSTHTKRGYNNKEFSTNLDPAAKKVSIAIIVILFLTIGGLWYVKNRSFFSFLSNSATSTDKMIVSSSSPKDIINLQVYSAGRDQIDKAISAELAKTGTTSNRSLQTAKQYTAANLLVSNNISSTTLHAYGVKIATALKLFGSDQENAIATMLNILQTGDRTQIQSILAQAAVNKEVLANLMKISVPKNATAVHLALVNTISRNVASLSDMATILDYPSVAIQSADLYRVQSIDFLKGVNRLNQFFQDNNVSFTSAEGGTVYAN